MKLKNSLFITALSVFPFSAGAQMQAELNGLVGTMSNGIIKLNIDKSGRANKMYHAANGENTNILGSSGIYFDYTADKNRALTPDVAKIVKLTDDYAEILYSNTKGDLRYEQGYILRKGESGVYTYVIVRGSDKASTIGVKETRVCTRLASTFLNGYVDDSMQGRIPSNAEMKEAEKDVNKVQDATYYLADRSIYTKYNWAQFVANDSVHGLMNDKVGVWNIPCSYEWINGGPMRQELTVHATSKSPITIQMLQGEHLGGALQKYGKEDVQIFGPFFIYVNSGASKEQMIADAKKKAHEKMQEWPFKWFENDLYPLDRSTVSGKINISGGHTPEGIQVVLGEPGQEIIRQGKKYIFWAKTDKDGRFSIKNVRKGDYSLYAYSTTGTNTEELEIKGITVGDEITDLGEIEWNPSDISGLLWNIGENNRKSDGYNISNAPRAYGLWEQVPADLTFTIGESNPENDWYYAQCKNGTWNVRFFLDEIPENKLKLTASVAGTTNKPKVAVSVNGQQTGTWSFPNNDASIYRSATQAGRHVVKEMVIEPSLLKAGENIVSLKMSGIGKNGGVMYDCLKLEKTGELSSVDGIETDESAMPYEVFTIGGTKIGDFTTLRDAQLPKGVYIYRHGTKTGKIIR